MRDWRLFSPHGKFGQFYPSFLNFTVRLIRQKWCQVSRQHWLASLDLWLIVAHHRGATLNEPTSVKLIQAHLACILWGTNFLSIAVSWDEGAITNVVKALLTQVAQNDLFNNRVIEKLYIVVLELIIFFILLFRIEPAYLNWCLLLWRNWLRYFFMLCQLFIKRLELAFIRISFQKVLRVRLLRRVCPFETKNFQLFFCRDVCRLLR